MFDVTLIFETYIRSLIAEVETAKARSDQYALSLEEKVRVRTQQLDKLARLDPLTGLLNIRQLNEVLTTVLRSAERQHEATTVVYIDVNDFKIINDTHGHQQGDEILQTVSEAIKGCARVEDYCFRYGGDEFLVILKNCTEQQARDIYLVALEKKMCAVGVSLSAGLAQTGPEYFVDGMALIKRADENMYVFKKAHKAAKKENLNI
jgi:diguanylate cyclase (GGDEF)-like protein